MDFHVVLERDETGAFVADVPVLPGCHSWGETRDEALRHVREAIALYLSEKGAPRSEFVAVETVHIKG